MMTEHEKLLAGQEYDYRDSELQQMIARGKKMIQEINTQTDDKKRSETM
ncbi:sugar O-acetyltransferase, partial [Lactiplantibacillus argentoratensis]|nr:sugar O-acetyltransferase [Lactiplantibacillus argentoratensis]